MARMRAGGERQGRDAGAVSVVLVIALLIGAVTVFVMAPGAGGQPASPRGATGLPAPGSRSAHRGDTDASADTGVSSGASSVVPALLHQPGSAGTAFVADPTTEAEVAVDLVHAIDVQSHGRDDVAVTLDNVALLETWMNNEGGLWADNPLNTSLDASRYPHQITASGVDTRIPIYPDVQIGIAATATTLLSNRAYAGILWVLGEGTASCETFARAVMTSPWAASHYGGNPSHFCGSSGGSGLPGPGTSACLRLRGRSMAGAGRSQRIPGVCGRNAGGTGQHVARRGRARAQKGRAVSVPARRRGPGPTAASHAPRHLGSTRHR
jgi:hypothetical protein